MNKQYDVIIIGGGINGAGIARDTSLRGLKTVLFEKKDIASGTTGASSSMIHGGIRYLTSNVNLTEKCCTDAGYIRNLAPFLFKRIPFIYTLKKSGSKFDNLKNHPSLMDGFFFAYDVFQDLKYSKTHVRLSGEEVRKIEPMICSDVESGFTFDEWSVNTNRLSILNTISAVENAAEIYTYHEVKNFLKDPQDNTKIIGVKVLDKETGIIHEVLGSVIINASGPWSPLLAKKAEINIKLRPSKGIHLLLERRISNYGIITRAIDGRMVFIAPLNDISIIGTTDDDYYGDLDNIEVTGDEIQYLIEAIENVIPGIKDYRLMGTWAGVRPTVYSYGINEDELSRDHKIIDHSSEGASGLFSLVGGKLADYRMMSEEITNKICEVLNVTSECKTKTLPLPGGEKEINISKWPNLYGISMPILISMFNRYGCRLESVLNPLFNDPRLRATICHCNQIISAEIKYSIEVEGAKTIDDIMRRTSAGFGSCGGVKCGAKIGMILGKYKGWDSKTIKENIIRFWENNWNSRKHIIYSKPQIMREFLNNLFLKSWSKNLYE